MAAGTGHDQVSRFGAGNGGELERVVTRFGCCHGLGSNAMSFQPGDDEHMCVVAAWFEIDHQRRIHGKSTPVADV